MRSNFFPIAMAFLTAVLVARAGPSSALTFQALHDFCKDRAKCDGQSPNSKLMLGPDGSLFGTTSLGGSGAQGVVFRIVHEAGNRWKTTIVHSFCAETDCADGSNPTGLIVGSDGSLYGTTTNGGVHSNAGVFFRLTPNRTGQNYKYTKLYDFCAQADCADGAHPISHLTYAGVVDGEFYDGRSSLYGISGATSGAIFELHKGSPWTESALYNFCAVAGCTDGIGPAELVYDTATKAIYGVAVNGGPVVDGQSYGVIFRLTKSKKGWRQAVLHAFCSATPCLNGAHPQSFLLANNGDFYGTTNAGGDADQGTAFAFQAPVGGSFLRLYSFCSRANCTDGAHPVGIAVDTATRTVFVTTKDGGNPEAPAGVVLDLISGIGAVLYTFCSQTECLDGGAPQVGPALGEMSGEVFGTTTIGGQGQYGTAFLLSGEAPK